MLDWLRAQVAVMQPGPSAEALQGLLRDLLSTSDGTSYVYRRLSGTENRYDVGDEHPMAGRDAPDFRLTDGTRLGELPREGVGVLLDFSAGASLRDAAAPWADRIRYMPGAAHDDLGRGAVLVRPDGVVAWTGERVPAPAAFEQAAARWF